MNHLIMIVLLVALLIGMFIHILKPKGRFSLSERETQLKQVDSDVQKLLVDGKPRSAEQLSETSGHHQRDVALTLQQGIRDGQVKREERPGELPGLYHRIREA